MLGQYLHAKDRQKAAGIEDGAQHESTDDLKDVDEKQADLVHIEKVGDVETAAKKQGAL